MTPEQMRVKLAEWAGWKRGITFESSFVNPSADIARECWYYGDKKTAFPFRDVPNYPEDLNAVAQLEKRVRENTLTIAPHLTHAWGSYIDWLRYVCGYSACIDATALQRCEALCKTLGLWEESK